MGRAAIVAYKRLASLLSVKREQPYSIIMGWLRYHQSFSLLRSAVMCLRGSRPRHNHVPRTSLDLADHEGRIPPHGQTYLTIVHNCVFFITLLVIIITIRIFTIYFVLMDVLTLQCTKYSKVSITLPRSLQCNIPGETLTAHQHETLLVCWIIQSNYCTIDNSARIIPGQLLMGVLQLPQFKANTAAQLHPRLCMNVWQIKQYAQLDMIGIDL